MASSSSNDQSHRRLGTIIAASAVLAGVAAVALRNRRPRLIQPPVAAIKPRKVLIGKVEGENRGKNPMDPPKEKIDNYYWLRDDSRRDSEMVKYLEGENAYMEAQTSHLKAATENLYREFLARIKETDESVPYPYGDYVYYKKTIEGLSYAIHCRKPRAGGAEEVILDINQLAKGKAHCDVHAIQPSPDHKILAYAVDYFGYETFTVRFKDLATGKEMDHVIENTAGDFEWGLDASECFYTTHDEAHRPFKLWRHKFGADQKTDEPLYTETDELFYFHIQKSTSGRYLFVYSTSMETSEVRYLSLKERNAPLTVIEPRQPGVRYSVTHQEDKFYILTNKDGAKNQKIMSTKIATPGAQYWQPVVPYNPEISVSSMQTFKNHAVIYGREGGLKKLWILGKDQALRPVTFEEPVYTAQESTNMEYDTDTCQFRYSSLVAPMSTFELNMRTGEKKLLKEEPVFNYDRTQYTSERIFATARDGTLVPMSMVYKKSLKKDGPQPLHLYGYGSYGATVDPTFNSQELSFLDRGVIYVIAHIRGGGSMGRSWYEDEGKYLKKKNTFYDFIDCAEHLIKTGYTSPDQLVISGRSAGGLLMGAVVNMRPDLFKAVVAGVPFVDVVTTMSDASIPLTTGEWVEWGNPNEEKYYEYMMSYSPYDNVKEVEYPAMLVVSGLYDPRVAYWEPAKWVAKLRAMKKDKNVLLLKMDMSSGHFSASDRYKYLKEKAFEFAFLLDQLNLLSEEDKRKKWSWSFLPFASKK